MSNQVIRSGYNTVFIDAGHSGEYNNEYFTAPSKMYTHKVPFNIVGEKTLKEGIKNRIYCEYLIPKLQRNGVNVVRVYNQFLDTPLHKRVEAANYYHQNVSPGIYLSEHSNATSQHTARGMVVFTSRGETTSDKLATNFVNKYKEKFPDIRVLTDMKDGDPDYEANFYVVSKTVMPAVLLENLFFDNYQDAVTLYTKVYLDLYTDLVCEWIIESLDYMNKIHNTWLKKEDSLEVRKDEMIESLRNTEHYENYDVANGDELEDKNN